MFKLTSLLRVIVEHVTNLDVNQKTKFDHTLIYLTAALRHLIIISVLVDYETIINVECERYNSLLHAACFAKHLKIIDNFIKLDVNIFCDVVFDDALQATCQNNHENMTFYLIESDSMIKFKDEYKQAFENAARAEFINVIEQFQRQLFFLLNKNKLDKAKNKTEKIIKNDQLDVICHCFDQQSNKKNVFLLDVVAFATLYNYKILIKFFLDENMNIKAKNVVETSLKTTCLFNCQFIVCLFLHRKAEINVCEIFNNAL